MSYTHIISTHIVTYHHQLISHLSQASIAQHTEQRRTLEEGFLAHERAFRGRFLKDRAPAFDETLSAIIIISAAAPRMERAQRSAILAQDNLIGISSHRSCAPAHAFGLFLH